MAQDFSQIRHGMLTPEFFNKEKTDWFEALGEDFILAHNPVFKYKEYYHPYKLEQVMAVFCEDGYMEGAVNLKPYHIEKNGFIIILAGQIMEPRFTSPQFKGTFIYMSGRFLRGLDIGDSYKFYQSVEQEPYFQLNDQMADAIRQYRDMTRSMLRISSFHPNAYEGIRLVTKAFFLLMGWELHQNALQKEVHTREGEVMSKFTELVKNHYTRHRDVEFYADKMNMTPKYMSTVVKKASGKSALQWIEEYVILDAKAQLASSLKSIQEIAYDLHFPNQSFFGRYFKRVVGVSASEYRRMVRGTTMIV